MPGFSKPVYFHLTLRWIFWRKRRAVGSSNLLANPPHCILHDRPILDLYYFLPGWLISTTVWAVGWSLCASLKKWKWRCRNRWLDWIELDWIKDHSETSRCVYHGNQNQPAFGCPCTGIGSTFPPPPRYVRYIEFPRTWRLRTRIIARAPQLSNG